ncbi:hypothetical protein THAOC_22947, partial [Thalassiosira oceanica]
MAAAFKVNDSNGIAAAFAAHDEFQSRVAKAFWSGETVMMEVKDDFYTAPYCLLKTEDGQSYIVFTSYKARNPHYEASNSMEKDAPLVAPSVHDIEKILGAKEDSKFVFREYAWAGGDDVNAALEENAVKVTCETMGWGVPQNWRDDRKTQSKKRIVGPVWDLSAYPEGMAN